MNFNLEDDIPFIDEDDQEEEICQRQEVDLRSIPNEKKTHRKEDEEAVENKKISKSKQSPLTINVSNGNIDFGIHELSEVIEQNETKKAKFPKMKFFKSTIWSLILLVLYYVDIVTDINLLIGYAKMKCGAISF